MIYVWLGLAVVFGLVEAAAPALVCIWFCLGAIVTFVTSFFVTDIMVQVIVFVVASALALLALRPFMRKRVNAKGTEAITDIDAYVGREVTVTQAVNGTTGGRVLLADVSWKARTADGAQLPSGSRARITAVDGNVLVVEAAA